MGGGKYSRVHFFWHYLANKILTFICNLFTNLNLTDMETGYKVFKSSALKSISLKEETFSFEPEVTIKLSKKNLSSLKFQLLIMVDHMMKEKKLI